MMNGWIHLFAEIIALTKYFLFFLDHLALDPFGHMVTSVYGDWLDKGW